MRYIDKLPEKWCVKADENNLDKIGPFYDRQQIKPLYNSKRMIGFYLTSHNLGSKISILSNTEEHKSSFTLCVPNDEFPEISFEDFERLVLGKNKEIEYEIY